MFRGARGCFQQGWSGKPLLEEVEVALGWEERWGLCGGCTVLPWPSWNYMSQNSPPAWVELGATGHLHDIFTMKEKVLQPLGGQHTGSRHSHCYARCPHLLAPMCWFLLNAHSAPPTPGQGQGGLAPWKGMPASPAGHSRHLSVMWEV